MARRGEQDVAFLCHLRAGSVSTIVHDGGGSLLRADGGIKFRRLHLRRPHCPYHLFARGLGYIPSGRPARRGGGKDFSDNSGAARRDADATTSTAAPIRSILSIVRFCICIHGDTSLFLFRIISNRLRPECLRERALKAIRLAINRPPSSGRPSMYVRTRNTIGSDVRSPSESQSLKRFAPELFCSLLHSGNINQNGKIK